MSRTLIVAFDPADAGPLSGFAQALGQPYDVLSFGSSPSQSFRAEKNVVAPSGDLPPADALASGLSGLASQYTHIAAVSSMLSKDVMARLAGLLSAGMVTDVIAVQSPTTFQRPIVAGTLIATVETLSTPVVFTVPNACLNSTPRPRLVSSRPTSPLTVLLPPFHASESSTRRPA